MPTIRNANLTLTTTGDKTKINVSYDVFFNSLEMHLDAKGLQFKEYITVMGMDSPGSRLGTVLHNFPSQTIQTVSGPVPIPVVHRNRTKTVPRLSLDEDPSVGDADEIRCRIEVVPVGMPTKVTQFTDQEVLLGP